MDPATTARVFNYKRSVNALSTFNGTDYITIPQRINVSRPHTIMVQTASITSNIPNVYNATALTDLPAAERVNTGLVRVSKDGGANWTSVQLTNGVYTPLNISNAINAAISSWYTLDTDPAFTIHSNSVIGICYIVIDSTKLAVPGQMCVDFAYNNSKMGELLGFVAVSQFILDGTYDSDAYPKLDWFGNYVDVHVLGFGPLSVVAGKSSDTAISIKLETATAVNSYSYPLTTGEHPFERPVASIPETISSLSLKFTGRDDKTIVCYDGEVSVIIVLKEH